METSNLTENVKIHLRNMCVVFKETFRSNLYLCIFISTGNLTLRFFSASSQNCLCFLSLCLVGVQICWWTEGPQGGLPNLSFPLSCVTFQNVPEGSSGPVSLTFEGHSHRTADEQRIDAQKCRRTTEINANSLVFAQKNIFLRLISWNLPGRWMCVTPILQPKIGPRRVPIATDAAPLPQQWDWNLKTST